MKLKEYDHPYYASSCNYYSNEAHQEWETMAEFLDEFENADVDMNLVFRWDLQPRDEQKTRWSAQVIIIGQRKGIYSGHEIKNVNEIELHRFEKYLLKHWDTVRKIWMPISELESVAKARRQDEA